MTSYKWLIFLLSLVYMPFLTSWHDFLLIKSHQTFFGQTITWLRHYSCLLTPTKKKRKSSSDHPALEVKSEGRGSEQLLILLPSSWGCAYRYQRLLPTTAVASRSSGGRKFANQIATVYDRTVQSYQLQTELDPEQRGASFSRMLVNS